jgi:hypothetical protein
MDIYTSASFHVLPYLPITVIESRDALYYEYVTTTLSQTTETNNNTLPRNQIDEMSLRIIVISCTEILIS